MAALGQGVDGPVYAILDNTYRFQGNLRGDIIVGGNFNNAYNPDGTPVPVTSLARWRWQTNSWEPIENGLSGTNVEVRTLAAEADGPAGLSANVYVGGKFNGGINADNTVVNSTNVIKLYQNDFPLHWEALGQGVDDIVYTLALRVQPGYEPLVWTGGEFQNSTNANGNVLNTPFLSLWDENSDQWFALGGGTNGPVYAIEVLATSYYDGAIIGGDFTLGYYQNGNARSLNHIALFNLSPPPFWHPGTME